MLLLVAVTVGIAFATTSLGDSTSPTTQLVTDDTSEPTITDVVDVIDMVDPSLCYQADTSYVQTENFIQMRTTIEQSQILILQSDLNASSTPQRKALCWLADVNTLTLTSNKALIQRFIIAIMYFAMVPETSKIYSSWLERDTSECQWD
eukprot:8696974-Ditylum_brightwellii.AAC.1